MSSEFSIIKNYFTRQPRAPLLHGNDDDAVILPPPAKGSSLVMTSDMLCEDIHFFANTDPFRLGWKSLAVNISDLAAMGAQPKYAQLSLALAHIDLKWIEQFAQGFWHCAERFDLQLTGGDTTKGKLTIAITALGEVSSRALLRSQAQVGDDIWLSGNPGYAATGLKILRENLHLADRQIFLDALEYPQPRVALGLALSQLNQQNLCHAAIDVSDGLLADLQHILELSMVSADIYLANFPPLVDQLTDFINITEWQTLQISGGDDYELCFTAPPLARSQINQLAHKLNLPLFCIGKITARDQLNSPPSLIRLYNHLGQAIICPKYGFEHFVSN